MTMSPERNLRIASYKVFQITTVGTIHFYVFGISRFYTLFTGCMMTYNHILFIWIRHNYRFDIVKSILMSNYSV
ncbi:MAG: hypothetical protein EBX95_14300 [Acidimicrobiia bacterium]|nr:hypothetical protein [Acidimicrobiia bacterium]